MKKYLVYSFYNILIIIILFFLLEIVIRISFTNIQLPGTSKELLIDSLYNTTVGLGSNKVGFSSEVKKTTNKYHIWKYMEDVNIKGPIILYLGDSVTMGIGVENDSTFVGINSKKINLINPSLIGYSVNDYLNVMKSFLSNNVFKGKIKKIYLFWSLNDLYSNFTVKNSPGLKVDNLFFPIIDYVRRNSKLFIYTKNLFSDRSKIYYNYDVQFYKESNEYFQKGLIDIKEISRICISEGINLTVFLLPYEYQLRENYIKFNYPQKLLLKKLSEFNINVFDIGERLSNYKYNSKSLYLYEDGIHFSKKGHKLLADIIEQTTGTRNSLRQSHK
ncbi:MAG: SGNH/GDSL hydrolase family protein [Bacteroidetes bacterium]|nr:SGNH/GDSL hydrolase family protein [Bacteroidota bacterium]